MPLPLLPLLLQPLAEEFGFLCSLTAALWGIWDAKKYAYHLAV